MRSLLVLLLVLVVYINAQAILPATMQKIFIYADKDKVKALTTALNKEAVAKQVTRLTNWGKTNEIDAKAKVDTKNPLSKKGASTDLAKKFVNHRDALKQFITVQYNQFKKDKFLTVKQADAMKKLYWKLDKENGQDFNTVSQLFLDQFFKTLDTKKVAEAQAKLQTVQDVFAKKKKTNLENLMFSLNA